MTQAYLFTGPMARKKRTDCHFDPNTYRVISQNAEVIPSLRTQRDGTLPMIPSSNLIGQPSLPRPESDHRHNRPNPNTVNFLRHDVRLLNEPVCDVKTKSTASEQHEWWPHRTTDRTPKTPARPNDTTIREDYQYRGSDVPVPRRFGSNTRSTVARGIVPVNFLKEPDGKQRFYQEGISYEHQFNSRVDPQYPVRAKKGHHEIGKNIPKRHGAFVWDRMNNRDVDHLLSQHNLTQSASQETRQAKEENTSRAESSKHQQQHAADCQGEPAGMTTVAV